MAGLETFRGSALNAIDAKGRVSLPAEIRSTIQSRHRRAVHESGYDPSLTDPRAGKVATLVKDSRRGCLIGYDDVYSNFYLAEISRRHEDKAGEERERAIQKDLGYFGGSEDLAWDVNGRIVMSPRMRARADIDGFVYFFSRALTFELWNPVKFHAAHKDSDPDWAEECRLDCVERGIAL